MLMTNLYKIPKVTLRLSDGFSGVKNNPEWAFQFRIVISKHREWFQIL